MTFNKSVAPAWLVIVGFSLVPHSGLADELVLSSSGGIMVGSSIVACVSIGQSVIGNSTSSSYAIGLGLYALDSCGVPTDVETETDAPIPNTFALNQNYPNPFNPSTTITFDLPKRSHISLVVFNSLGQEVRRLANSELPAGTHRVIWDGRADNGSLVASGIYFYKLFAEDFSQTRKMLLLK